MRRISLGARIAAVVVLAFALLIGVLVALGVVALLVRAASLNSVAVVSLPALVIVLLGASLTRARQAKR